MLQVRDIRFSYGEPVLKGLSFEVSEGQTLAVLGPNGSGKTTLLKTIDGILSPSTGSVLIDGRNLTKASRR